MSNRRAVQVAQDFLSVVWKDEPPNVTALIQAIDRLLADSHKVEADACAEEQGDPPKATYSELYRDVAARFPALGTYPVADPLGPIAQDWMLGDAVDDIADITTDLREVIWRDQNLGPSDAAWCFRLLYPHWAEHARSLSLYLHALQRVER